MLLGIKESKISLANCIEIYREFDHYKTEFENFARGRISFLIACSDLERSASTHSLKISYGVLKNHGSNMLKEWNSTIKRHLGGAYALA